MSGTNGRAARHLAVFLALALGAPLTASGQPARPSEDPADPELAEAERLDLEVLRLHREGKYDEAIPLAERSLEIRERKLGEYHLDVAVSRNSLGALWWKKGDYRRAQPHLERALEILQRELGEEDSAVATLVSNLAMLHKAMGDYARAALLNHRALGIRERTLGPDHADVAISLNNLGGLYQARGDFERAEALLQRALAIRERKLSGQDPDVALSLNNLASLYQDKGDYLRAEKLYLRALAILEKNHGDTHPSVASYLSNLATVYWARGDYARAQPLLERALAIHEKTLGDDHPEVAASLYNLATIYQDTGDYSRAEALYLRALAICEEKLEKGHVAVASSLGNLAGLYVNTGDYARAEPLLERALAIRVEALGDAHPDVARSLSNLAMFHQAKGSYARAHQLLGRALAILETNLGKDHPDVAKTLENLATLCQATKDYDRAIELRVRASEIREQHLGVYLGIGSEPQKRAYMNLLTGETLNTISLHAQGAPDNSAALRLSLTTILRRKGRVMDESAASMAALRRHGSPEAVEALEALSWKRAALARLVLGGIGRDPGGYRAAVESAKAEVQKLEDELAELSAEFRSQRARVTIESVRAAIPNDAALVEIAWYRPFDATKRRARQWGEPRYVAYVFGHGGATRWVDLGEAAAVDRVVRDARSAFSDARFDVRAAGRALHRMVVAPLMPLLGDARTVIVSPDGALNLVPLGAAIDEKGRYFLETHAVHYVTSGRELLRAKAERSTDGRAVIVADPAFDESRSRTVATRGMQSGDFGSIRFARLPGSKVEAEAISCMLDNPMVLTGAAATEGAVKEVAGPRILHMATHGFFLFDQERTYAGGRGMVLIERGSVPEIYREDPLLRSGLAFSGANERASGRDDGILTAEEAKGLDLYGTKLVVLSACDTGMGEVKNGQGVYGLRRALVLAGAETQVMSLWKVDDEATRELMVAYYQRLFAGEGRAEALRQAQLSMMREHATAHPSYWAAFVLSGNAQTLEGKPSRLCPVPPGKRGCGCRAVGTRGEMGWWWPLLTACAIAVGTRRRSRGWLRGQR